LPAYLSVMPAVAQLTLMLWHRWAKKKLGGFSWQRAGLVTVAGCLMLNVLAMAYLLALQPRTGWIPTLRQWRELAAAVQTVDERLKKETGREPLIIGTDKYRIASVLAFYRTPMETDLRASDFTTSGWILGGEGLGYPYWTTKDKWIGGDCIVVDDDQNELRGFAQQFRTFEMASQIQLNRKTYYIGIGHGLRN